MKKLRIGLSYAHNTHDWLFKGITRAVAQTVVEHQLTSIGAAGLFTARILDFASDPPTRTERLFRRRNGEERMLSILPW